ncbi:MFS transporter [Ornithinimicrobium sp. Y1847]|uniref:MFS transporter n=1 Tax=Ornithinimicrobium sp. Y1847 TaxID=3405419 RepID=UPI003B6706C9
MTADPQVRHTGIYRRLAWPVLVPSVLFGVAAGATVPVSVVAAIQLGASAWLASLIIAIVGAISLATTVPAGQLIDRVGDRPAMALATGYAAVLTIGSIVALVWGLSGDGDHGVWPLVLFMASTFLRAPALNVWSLARQAYVADRLPTAQVGRAMTALGGTMRAGNLLGPLLGGLLLLFTPLWSVWVLSMVCTLIALAVVYSPRLGGRLDENEGATRPRTESRRRRRSGTAVGEPSARLARAPLDVRWRAVLLAGVAIVTLAVARVAQPVVIQLWGVHLELSPSTISWIVAAGAALEMVLMFPGGYLKDRLGRAPILIACLVVYGGGFLLLPLQASVAWMVFAVLVMAVGNGLGAGVNMTIGADLSPREGRGRFLGIWALFSNVGVLGGPALVALLVAMSTVSVAAVSIGAVAVLGAAWMAVFARFIGLPRGVLRPDAAQQPVP